MTGVQTCALPISAITGVALPIVAVASMGFIAGDAVKAVVASAVVAGLAKLK